MRDAQYYLSTILVQKAHLSVFYVYGIMTDLFTWMSVTDLFTWMSLTDLFTWMSLTDLSRSNFISFAVI